MTANNYNICISHRFHTYLFTDREKGWFFRVLGWGLVYSPWTAPRSFSERNQLRRPIVRTGSGRVFVLKPTWVKYVDWLSWQVAVFAGIVRSAISVLVVCVCCLAKMAGRGQK